MAYLKIQVNFEIKMGLVMLAFHERFHNLCFVILCNFVNRTIGAKVRSLRKGNAWAVRVDEGMWIYLSPLPLG